MAPAGPCVSLTVGVDFGANAIRRTTHQAAGQNRRLIKVHPGTKFITEAIMTPKEISKFLSYVLRHDPDSIGLKLDMQGWVLVDDLIAKAGMTGQIFDRASLDNVVATSDKQRFTLSDDGKRIRAAQGHSVCIDLGLEPTDPPAVLFHGTATSNLNSIFAEGLKPGRRQKVHLSIDHQTATKVGSRHGQPAVLSVYASRMNAEGYLFWRAENGVWLTDEVPAKFLSLIRL